jgi:RNA polymerase sigma factor (TIGR02999 family)
MGMDGSNRREEAVTALLAELAGGDAAAIERLLPLVYEELRGIAHAQLRHERQGHTLNTTALVHEAYFRLVDLERVPLQGRAHFFAIAARAMRQILINYAVRRKAAKRGGGQQPVVLDDADALPDALTDAQAEEVLALDEALQRLVLLDERQARVVELRFFAGMDIEETAAALGISPATVKRDWTVARAWLNRELKN